LAALALQLLPRHEYRYYASVALTRLARTSTQSRLQGGKTEQLS
jgi:hypothetical protein